MTERLDLSGVAPTREAADRVVAAVMARVRSQDEPPGGVLDTIGVAVRFRWVAAAAVLAAAVALALVARAEPVSQSADLVAQWVSLQHVPSNGELLTTFQGYRQ